MQTKTLVVDNFPVYAKTKTILIFGSEGSQEVLVSARQKKKRPEFGRGALRARPEITNIKSLEWAVCWKRIFSSSPDLVVDKKPKNY